MRQKWKRYTIMHMERKVAAIRADGTCTIYARTLLPYNIYLEETKDDDVAARLNNLENFYHWCASRVLTLDRKYAKEIMNSIGQKQAVTDRDRAEIAIAYHGLTLTDVYWIKGDREICSFSDINLYAHSLSDAFVDVTLRGKQLTAQNSGLIHPSDIAGDISTMGVAPKAWIRREGTFYLLKDGDKNEVDAELLASRVARCFRVPQVLYEAERYNGEAVTKSKIVTSLDTGIVASEFVEIYALNRDVDFLSLVLEKDAYGYHMMNIVDYLVGNTDRHWGNWGFAVDNRTNRLMGLHPLMDFNRAFTAYDTLDGVRCQTTRETLSQREAAVRAVRAVGLNQIAEVQRKWFENEAQWDMFSRRLATLKSEEKTLL